MLKDGDESSIGDQHLSLAVYNKEGEFSNEKNISLVTDGRNGNIIGRMWFFKLYFKPYF